MIETCWILVVALIPLLLIIQFCAGILRIRRDILFIAYFAQVYIYLHLAPTVNMYLMGQEDRKVYALLQWSIFFLFDIPFVVLYNKWIGKNLDNPFGVRNIFLETPALNRFVFSLLVVSASVLFLYVAISNELFFRRIGHEGLAARSASMSMPELVLYRMFSETSTFLLMLGYFLILNCGKKHSVSFTILVCSVAIHTAVYGSFILVNNRLQTMVLLFLLFVTVSYWWKITLDRTVFPVTKLVFIALLLILSANVVLELRGQYERYGEIHHYDVMEFREANYSDVGFALAKRLDGIKLMAQITGPALDNGFMWGQAWIQPLSVLYYMFVDPEKAKELKKKLRTNPKVFIAKFYLNADIPDVASSVLTDLYANFFILGFLFLALVASYLLVFITRQMINPRSRSGLLIGFYLLPFIFKFEKEFLSLMLNMVKFSPMLLLVLFTNPVRLRCEKYKVFVRMLSK